MAYWLSGSYRAPDRRIRLIPGYADVVGQVLQASGAPLSASSIEIKCVDGRIEAKATTDDEGRYGASLTAGPGLMPAATNSGVLCQFGAPDSVNSRIRAQAVIHFAPAGIPHPRTPMSRLWNRMR